MDKILKDISDCIVNMDEDNIENLINKAVENKIDLDKIYLYGLNDGMTRVLILFDEKKIYLPEVIVCADTLNKGIGFLKAYGHVNNKSKGTIIFAVVKGDTHEIGKNIVKIMLEASGYNVIDLGVNVDSDVIIKRALQEKAEVIALSSMMTTTMKEMAVIIKQLNEIQSDSIPFVIIGGGCISKKFAYEISADGYSANGPNAVKLVNNLMRG